MVELRVVGLRDQVSKLCAIETLLLLIVPASFYLLTFLSKRKEDVCRDDREGDIPIYDFTSSFELVLEIVSWRDCGISGFNPVTKFRGE